MIKLFKVKEKQREHAENANGKPPIKKQSAGELRLHKELRKWRKPPLISSPAPIILPAQIVLVNPANQINSVKLTDDNYLLWQLRSSLCNQGLGLEAFILETPFVPSKVVSTEDTMEIINPSYVFWCHRDQLLFYFLLASMTEGVQSQMIGCETSSQIWLRVSRLFASRSKARIMQYKLQLQTLKKGNLNMRDYLGKMKGYIDILAACGHSIFEEDQILHIPEDVGLEYDYVVVHVTPRVDVLSVSEVGALLLAHEGRIGSFNGSLDTTVHAVNAVVLSSHRRPDNSSSDSSFCGRGRGRGRYHRGGRRGWNNNCGRLVCQICGIGDHVAHKCYQDFVSVQNNMRPQYSNHNSYNRSSNQSPVAAMAMAGSGFVGF